MCSRLFSFSVLMSAAALAQPVELPRLNTAETKRLDAGETVIRNIKPTDNKGIGLESMGVIDASSTEVWPVLRDCQYFSQFMPRTKASSALEEKGVPLCHVELQLPFPLANLWSDTSSVQREEPEGHYYRQWTLVRGTYHRNGGSWTVLPWGPEGKKTLVRYVIDANPALLVPDWVLRAGQAGSLPEVFASIRKRVITLRELAATAKPPAAARAE